MASEWTPIPKANPLARKVVEKGEYCKRTNLNKVDPNRNWDFNFIKGSSDNNEDTNAGQEPFSEIESLFMKEAVEDWNPDIYITLHSGIYGLFYPFASELNNEAPGISQLKLILNEVKTKFCSECVVGTPSQVLGYISPGNSLDYIFKKFNAKYSTAWEIYTSDTQINSSETMFDGSSNKNEMCLNLFNPNEKNKFDHTINRWTSALIYTLNRIKESEFAK